MTFDGDRDVVAGLATGVSSFLGMAANAAVRHVLATASTPKRTPAPNLLALVKEHPRARDMVAAAASGMDDLAIAFVRCISHP
jgi:hypothetical protein